MTQFSTFTTLSKFATGALAVFSLATCLSLADTVQTRDGSRFTGKITQIDGASVVLNTGFAGDIKIKTGEVVSLSTDAPVNVRLADGTVATGAASMSAPGTLVIAAAGGPVSIDTGKIKQSWAADAKDPEVAKLERQWSYEAGLDVSGKDGNHSQTGVSVSFRATRKSSVDTLLLYAGYDRQVTNGNKSADQARAGADYRNNFSGRFSWYARDELGFDRVKFIDFYNTAAAGLGYDIIKCAKQGLTFRTGLAHRYEKYSAAGAGSLSTLAIDFGLAHNLTMKHWSMNNLVTYTPSVDNFNTYRVYHESSIELPMASPRWKFRVGVSNDYHSPIPVGATRRLDTTYFARLILSWK